MTFDYTTCDEAKAEIGSMFDMSTLEGMRQAEHLYRYARIAERDEFPQFHMPLCAEREVVDSFQARIEAETGRRIMKQEGVWVFLDCGHEVEPHGIYNIECQEAGNECEEIARLQELMHKTDHLALIGERR